MINKGMTSFFAYPLLSGARFFGLKLLFFLLITGRKTLKNIFHAHEFLIFVNYIPLRFYWHTTLTSKFRILFSKVEKLYVSNMVLWRIKIRALKHWNKISKYDCLGSKKAVKFGIFQKARSFPCQSNTIFNINKMNSIFEFKYSTFDTFKRWNRITQEMYDPEKEMTVLKFPITGLSNAHGNGILWSMCTKKRYKMTENLIFEIYYFDEANIVIVWQALSSKLWNVKIYQNCIYMTSEQKVVKC